MNADLAGRLWRLRLRRRWKTKARGRQLTCFRFPGPPRSPRRERSPRASTDGRPGPLGQDGCDQTSDMQERRNPRALKPTYRPRTDEGLSSQSMTARGSSASFAGRSAAAAGACVACGCSRRSTLDGAASGAPDVDGTLTGTTSGSGEPATAGAGLAARAPSLSVTRVHDAVAANNPATRTFRTIRSVLFEIMVRTSVRFRLPLCPS